MYPYSKWKGGPETDQTVLRCIVKGEEAADMSYRGRNLHQMLKNKFSP